MKLTNAQLWLSFQNLDWIVMSYMTRVVFSCVSKVIRQTLVLVSLWFEIG